MGDWNDFWFKDFWGEWFGGDSEEICCIVLIFGFDSLGVFCVDFFEMGEVGRMDNGFRELVWENGWDGDLVGWI